MTLLSLLFPCVASQTRSNPSDYLVFFFNHTPTPEIYTLSLHDALPIWPGSPSRRRGRECPGGRRHACGGGREASWTTRRSEEHTSELQSHSDLVCRLLLEKKKIDREVIGFSVLVTLVEIHTDNVHTIT